MESQTSTQLKVGIFLSIGIIFILGSIFLLGADRALFTSYIRVHAHFDQVQGLSEGSVVSLSGVPVGNVEKITFLSEKNALDVQMRINEEYIGRVRQGSQVEVRTQGALGDKFVFIIPGDPSSPVVKEGDVLDIAKPTDLIGIISERGNETNRIFDTINELYKLTASLNADNRLVRIMGNLETASSNMSQMSKEAHRVLTNMNEGGTGDKLTRSVEKLDSILTKIDKGQGTLGALINDPSVHNQLKAMLGGSTQQNRVKSLLRTSIEKETKD
ncbi:ABC transporter substrate-binding protein [Bdellovibrio bacteriovorus]|uniref:ABC transporter substrate-binding protein n=1 Tax=Bdellovibrio bacteriovorus TaxID=959 RepID=A0A150WV89_BDEBC|nr:MlaD family protein [Bdellovibrio bacteriovorus]KYG70438.1 ABC transporter substrate-binding protein [Bdellovibrio bacteriovorus]